MFIANLPALCLTIYLIGIALLVLIWLSDFFNKRTLGLPEFIWITLLWPIIAAGVIIVGVLCLTIYLLNKIDKDGQTPSDIRPGHL